jgi:hypothetical protein
MRGMQQTSKLAVLVAMRRKQKMFRNRRQPLAQARHQSLGPEADCLVWSWHSEGAR